MSASLALFVIFVVVSFGGIGLGQQYDGQYPSFPMLPWLTVPQRYTSGSNLGPLGEFDTNRMNAAPEFWEIITVPTNLVAV